MSIERKLAAIMFTDIAGYTEQMSKDQDVAFVLLEEKQSKFKPLIKEHNGTLIKEMGDGTLSQYPTAVDASKCSVELQKLIQDNDKLNVRVGIHLGDTLFKDGDVFGDGVNIAARLESMSPAGGVLVSKNVYDELLSREGFEGVSLGLQSLKGVGRLVEVYALKDAHLTVPNPDDYTENKIEVHSDDEVPSIAIIPFDNKGADEDVFYAYGISADLISDCSGAGLIRVASLSNIEKVENFESLQAEELASKLDVRYTAGGTLWKMGDMFQLSVELYDTKHKKVVWSDRWQEKWDNLPTIKGSLSDGLLKALDTKPKVEQKIETANPEAYEFYLKAKHKYEKRENTEDTEIARGLLQKAIELDDNLIVAKNLLGTTYTDMGDYDEAMEIYTSTLKQAEELGDKCGMGYSLNSIGIVYWYKNNYDKALNFFSKSLVIRQKIGDKQGMGRTLGNIGILHSNKDEYNKALEYFDKSLKIQKMISDKYGIAYTLNSIGIVYSDKEEFDKALEYYNRSLKIKDEIGDRYGIGATLNTIGILHSKKEEFDKALGYYNRSLKIKDEIGDRQGMAMTLKNIGFVHSDKCDNEKVLDYYNRSLAIQEELGDRRGMGITLNGIGVVQSDKGDYDKALDYYDRSLKITDELSDERGMGYNLSGIGKVRYNKGCYEQAVEQLEKSLNIQKEIGLKVIELETTTYFYLSQKQLAKDYDINEINNLIKETKNIDYDLNFRLYQLLEESSYLKTACNQVQEKVSAMEKELADKFLSYPIPKQIVEEWEKINKV